MANLDLVVRHLLVASAPVCGVARNISWPMRTNHYATKLENVTCAECKSGSVA